MTLEERIERVLLNDPNNQVIEMLTEENEKNLDDIFSEWFSPVEELDELLDKFLTKSKN